MKKKSRGPRTAAEAAEMGRRSHQAGVRRRKQQAKLLIESTPITGAIFAHEETFTRPRGHRRRKALSRTVSLSVGVDRGGRIGNPAMALSRMIRSALRRPPAAPIRILNAAGTLVRVLDGETHQALGRRLNPRTCRGCGKVFQPRTALSRYGSARCKLLGGAFQSRAMPGAAVTHG